MTDINVKLLDISSASDGDVLKYVAANGTVEYGAAPGASAINTSIVTVIAGSFYIDSSLKPTLSLEPGSTYKFDQSDSSNSGHPLRFSTISDGTHSSGTEYTTGVTYVGTPGSSGSYTQIVVNYNTPTLYYYCSNHSGMGSSSVVGNSGDVTGNLTGNLISASNGAVVVDSGSYNQANFYGILNGDLNGTIRNSLGQLVLDNGSIGGTPNFGGNVAGDLTGNVIGEVIHKTTGAKVINMQYPTSVYTGNVVGDLEGTIRNSLGQLVLDNGSIGGTPSFGGVSDTVANLSNHSIQALGNINSNDTIASGDFMLYDNSSSHFGFVNFQSEVNSYITAATTNLQIQDLTDVDSVDSLATGDILLYDNSSSQFSFTNFEAEVLAYVNASTAHNANDYATYTTVTGLINTVQANLTSVIGAAPTTLDTLAEIAAALENDANIAVTLTNAIGTVSANAATNATNIDTVQANLSVLPDSAANDYATYTTVTGLINTVQANVTALPDSAANDYSTYTTVTGLIDTVQANVTALPDSAANDYSTYTTLSGLIDTVQDNVVATGNTTNTWVNSNDYSTYTTVTANLYNTYTSLISDINLVQGNVTSLTSTVDSADANLYNTYITVTGLIDTVQANVTVLPDSAANDYSTYTTVTGLIDTVQANVTTNTTSINTVQSNLTALTSSDLDMGGNKVLFGNMYTNEASLPSASTYHGMFAHVHDTGKGYFAHAGSWIKLLDETSSTTSNLTEGTNLYYSDDRVNTALNTSSANTSTVLSWNGTDYAWVTQSSGGTNYPWSNVSSNVSASAGDKLFVDTSTAAITITLPASPVFGSEIRVIDIKGNSANNKITLDNNGNNIEGITDSLEVNINRAAFGLVFYDATEGWVFIEK